MSALMLPSVNELPLPVLAQLRKYPVDPADFSRNYAESLDPVQAARLTLMSSAAEDEELAATLESYTDEALTQGLQALASRLLGETETVLLINAHLTQAIKTQSLTSARWVLEQARSVYDKCAQMAFIRDAQGRLVLGEFAPAPALKALELIGKHVDVQAFKEVVEVQGDADLARVLDLARKRAERAVIDVEPEQDSEIEGDIAQISDDARRDIKYAHPEPPEPSVEDLLGD
jgi:hypothetical protein